MRQWLSQSAGFGADYYHGDSSGVEVLLILNAAIQSYEDLKAGTFCKGQQFAVLLASKSLFGGGAAIVTGQGILEFPRDALVEQHFHPSWPTTRDLACSSA